MLFPNITFYLAENGYLKFLRGCTPQPPPPPPASYAYALFTFLLIDFVFVWCVHVYISKQWPTSIVIQVIKVNVGDDFIVFPLLKHIKDMNTVFDSDSSSCHHLHYTDIMSNVHTSTLIHSCTHLSYTVRIKKNVTLLIILPNKKCETFRDIFICMDD